MSVPTEQEKQDSMQKHRDQQNKDRGGPKVVPYTGFLTPKNAYALKGMRKKTQRKKVAQGKSSL